MPPGAQPEKQRLVIVIKIGTSSLINEKYGTLNLSSLSGICEVVRELHAQGHHVIIVSSGAVGVGCQRLGLVNRPAKLAQKQALAAIGQVHLMRYYEDILNALGLVLLTLENLADRSQYVNARNTFTELLAYNTIPVVNENDTVAVQELRFGDNDTLSAQVATLVEADYLFLLTDVDALYTANPKSDPTATPIHEVQDITSLTADTSTSGTQWGTGGMVTKLTAGRIATAAGCCMVICTSARPGEIVDILGGARKGTKFSPLANSLKGRKRWLLTVPVRGALWLDDGAVRAVRDKHKSLFSVGVIKVVGDFSQQDAVSLCDAAGVEFARGLSNFDSKELLLLQGKHTAEFAAVLGYVSAGELIHRGNLALLAPGEEEETWPKRGMRERLSQRLASAEGGGGASHASEAATASLAAAALGQHPHQAQQRGARHSSSSSSGGGT